MKKLLVFLFVFFILTLMPSSASIKNLSSSPGFQTKEALDELLAKNPNDVSIIEYIVGLLFAAKDYDKALGYVNRGLSLNPKSEKLLKYQGDLFAAKGDFSPAANSYELLVGGYPKLEYKITLAHLYMAQNKPDSAERILTPIYNSADNTPEVSADYLKLMLWQNKTAEAYEVVKAHNLFDTQDGLVVQGDIAQSLNKYKESYKFYSKALLLEPSNIAIQLKLAQSLRSQKERYDAEQIYKNILKENPSNLEAQNGLAYLSLDRREFDKAKAGFKNILASNPNDKDAGFGLAYSYIGNGDNLRALRQFDTLPQDDNVRFQKAKVYYDMNMFSDVDKLLRGRTDKDSLSFRNDNKRMEAYIFAPRFSLLRQSLSETYKLDINKIEIPNSKLIGNNLTAYTNYNEYVYTSGHHRGIVYNNFTNEVKMGVFGRPNEKLEFKADAGAKFFQEQDAMANTDSWITYYFNDYFNLKLGFYRDNVEQSYVSAVGEKINGVYTGQVADNKVYLEYNAKLPKKFYSFGRAGYGVMCGQNLLTNPYGEGTIGFGRTIYDDKDAKWFQNIALELVSYNSSYKYDLLDLYDYDNLKIGGYWSPSFFTADSFDIKLEGKHKKFTYGLKGLVGGQVAITPNQNNAVWGASVYVCYKMNEHVGFKLEYNNLNYADVQKNWAAICVTIRGFKRDKK